MKKRNLLIGIALLILATLACNSLVPNTAEVESVPTQTSPQLISEADVPRIDVRDAKAALDSGAAVIVDVRSAESFAASRVAGAISIPLQNFEGSGIQNLSLEKDQWIITYCT
jgi:3-mercaptopyruvate sulfurtransferase SseA